MKPAFCCLICLAGLEIGRAGQSKPIRKLSYDPAAPVVDLLSENARGKLNIRVIPQNEFLSRIRVENLTGTPLTVRLPKAVAAVHALPPKDAPPARRVRTSPPDPAIQEPAGGTGQAVVGSFGPMHAPAAAFPLQSEQGNGFTIPAGRSVQILLHSACAEHGKRPPISRMTYQLKPLDQHIENDTLRKVVQSYNPRTTDSRAFQAVVWHLANGMSWESLARKTVKRGGQTVSYFTRAQILAAQQLLKEAQR